MGPQAAEKAGTWRRLTAVTAEGVASGAPLMVGSKLLQGWPPASGVPLAPIGAIPLAELPTTRKLFWASPLERRAITWAGRAPGGGWGR